MKEFPRISSELGTPGAALLRAAQDEAPPAGLMEQTLLVVAAAGAAGALTSGSTVPAAVAAKTAKAGTALIAKYLVVGFASGVVTIGGGAAVHHAVTKPSAVIETRGTLPVSVREGAPAVPPLPERAVGAEVPPVPEAAPVATTASKQGDAPAPVPTRAPSPSVAVPAPAPVPVDTLMETEVRFLDEARAFVAQGKGREALAVLGRYAREVRNQRLAPEAWYLEMEANHVLGDRAAAVRSATNLLERYPEGPHSARARRIVSGR